MFSKSLMSAFSKRSFSRLYQYSNATNPKAFLTVSQAGNPIGDLVFELYADRQPGNTSNFQALCDSGYSGTTITKGVTGLGFKGGRISEDNASSIGLRIPDEDRNVRHYKRGILSMCNDGTNANGSEFLVTFDQAAMLDGY